MDTLDIHPKNVEHIHSAVADRYKALESSFAHLQQSLPANVKADYRFLKLKEQCQVALSKAGELTKDKAHLQNTHIQYETLQKAVQQGKISPDGAQRALRGIDGQHVSVVSHLDRQLRELQTLCLSLSQYAQHLPLKDEAPAHSAVGSFIHNAQAARIETSAYQQIAVASARKMAHGVRQDVTKASSRPFIGSLEQASSMALQSSEPEPILSL